MQPFPSNPKSPSGGLDGRVTSGGDTSAGSSSPPASSRSRSSNHSSRSSALGDFGQSAFQNGRLGGSSRSALCDNRGSNGGSPAQQLVEAAGSDGRLSEGSPLMNGQLMNGQGSSADVRRTPNPQSPKPQGLDFPRVLVLANAPFFNSSNDGKGLVQPPGGLTSGVAPVLARTPGSFAISSDPLGPNGQSTFFDASPFNPPFVNVGVPIPRVEYQRYYSWISNGIIWPVSHAMTDPKFVMNLSPEDARIAWMDYRNANARFAVESLKRSSPGDLFFVHDYHLQSVPAMLRADSPDANIAYFHHIPFPAPRVFFDHIPVEFGRELLRGLLGADLVGFHTRGYALNFLNSVQQAFSVEEVRIDRANLTITLLGGRAADVHSIGRVVSVGWFPISIDVEHIRQVGHSERAARACQNLKARYPGRRIFFGVERFDYTKGLLERLLAFEKLIEEKPELQSSVAFLQHVAPSRQGVQAYTDYREAVVAVAQRINRRWPQEEGPPLVDLREEKLELAEILGFAQAADVVVVTPIRDGMNLGIKEMVVGGSLHSVFILGSGAGAAEELVDCELVDGESPDSIKNGYLAALRDLEFDPAGVTRRVRSLRDVVHGYPITTWQSVIVRGAAEAVEARRTGRHPPQGVLSQQRLRAAGAATPNNVATDLFADAASLGRDLAQSSRVVFVIPFDGGLARVTPDPREAVLDGPQVDVLEALLTSPDTGLVVTSGRSPSDLAQRMIRFTGVAGFYRSALHGGAFSGVGLDCTEAHAGLAQQLQSVREMLRTELQKPEGGDGIELEDKGPCLAIHYRAAPAMRQRVFDKASAALECFGLQTLFRIIHGDYTVEIIPHEFSPANIVRQVVKQHRLRQLPLVEGAGSGKTAVTERAETDPSRLSSSAFREPPSRLSTSGDEDGAVVVVIGNEGTDSEVFSAVSEIRQDLVGGGDLRVVTIAFSGQPSDSSADYVIPSADALFDLLAAYARSRNT